MLHAAFCPVAPKLLALNPVPPNCVAAGKQADSGLHRLRSFLAVIEPIFNRNLVAAVILGQRPKGVDPLQSAYG